ncbi:MAG TPA: cytochrome P450 [Tepidisphaeraceae bacterium]|jgi:cytochrome P450
MQPAQNLFSDEARRNPYPIYAHLREHSPVLREPHSGLWMVFDYAGVNRVLTDHETFSSRYGPDWLIFKDPPKHTKLRALISRAFTPRSVVNLEPRIGELTRELLDPLVGRGQMDLAGDFSVQLPMMVIAEMLGIPTADCGLFKTWADVILDMSYTVVPGEERREEAARATANFVACTAETADYLARLLRQRQTTPGDDLLTRLAQAEVDGQRLTPEQILGFFQLLLLAGSETTTNLINNAILCFIEHPEELARVRADPSLLPRAIEEVLRYRSPLQWIYRVAKRDVEMADGQVLPTGKLVLAMIGSANHDPRQFPDPERFDVARDPNPHIAFGHGPHFCLGAPLARLEARVALTELLGRLKDIRLASDRPWEPRRGLHVHGPSRLPIQFEPPRYHSQHTAGS